MRVRCMSTRAWTSPKWDRRAKGRRGWVGMEISGLEGDGGMGAEGGCLPLLPPSLLCTQGLPALMCTLRLLAAFPTRVSTPLWPISSIFITFCNAQRRVPNLKSALFPNVFVISTPGPSGCAFPNPELWLVGAARSPAPHSCYPEPCAPSCPAPGAQPWAQERDSWCVKRPGPISCFWWASAAVRLQGRGSLKINTWLFSCASLMLDCLKKGADQQVTRLLKVPWKRFPLEKCQLPSGQFVLRRMHAL